MNWLFVCISKVLFFVTVVCPGPAWVNTATLPISNTKQRGHRHKRLTIECPKAGTSAIKVLGPRLVEFKRHVLHYYFIKTVSE